MKRTFASGGGAFACRDNRGFRHSLAEQQGRHNFGGACHRARQIHIPSVNYLPAHCIHQNRAGRFNRRANGRRRQRRRNGTRRQKRGRRFRIINGWRDGRRNRWRDRGGSRFFGGRFRYGRRAGRRRKRGHAPPQRKKREQKRQPVPPRKASVADGKESLVCLSTVV